MSGSLQSNNAPPESEQISELRSQLEVNQAKLRVAKIAYHNRSELDGKILEYEDVAAVAKAVIAVNYELQKQLYGEVRMKMSVSKLLRATTR